MHNSENDDDKGRQMPLAGAAGLAVRLSFVAGLVGLVLGVGLGRNGTGDAFIAREPSPDASQQKQKGDGEPKEEGEAPKAGQAVTSVPMRAIHAPAAAWAQSAYRDSVLTGLRNEVVSGVQLDLVDLVDLRRSIRQVHAAGGQVIGRVVVRDLASLDPVAPAARRGIDAIVLDLTRYRRSDPSLLLTRAGRVLNHDVRLGIALTGAALLKGDGSLTRELAHKVDFMAPIVFPSSWADGSLGIAEPEGAPHRVVKKALTRFLRHAQGTGVEVLPWLQDFSNRVSYGPAQITAQLRAVAAVGLEGWLLFNPQGHYTGEALERIDAT